MNNVLKLIEQFYEEKYDLLFSYALSILNDQYLAEDAVHNTFHEAFKKADALKSHPNINGWLFNTLKNKTKDIQRAKKRNYARFVSLDAMNHNYPSYERELHEIVDSKEFSWGIVESLLAPDDFYLLKSIVLDEKSHSMAAAELGISLNTSYKRLERIRSKLKKYYFP